MSETKTNSSTVTNSFYFAKGFSNGESGYKIRNVFHFGASLRGESINGEMTKDTSITSEMTKDTSITAEQEQGGLFVLEGNSDSADLPDAPNVNHQHIKAA